MDVEAQDDGVLAKILVSSWSLWEIARTLFVDHASRYSPCHYHHLQTADGAKNIKVGTLIAVTAEEGDDLSAAADFAAKAESESPSEEPASEPKKEEPKKEESKPAETSAPKKTEAPAKEELKAGDIIFASPIARKIALEKGIPLSKVKGTGPEGRIIRADVEAYKPSAAGSSATSTTTIGAQSSSAPAAAYTDTPVSNMRKTIGTRLTASKTEIPHYYVTMDIDMERTLKLREVFNASIAKDDSKAKLSVNDFIVKASALALRDVPEANSAWLGDAIRQ